MKMNVKNVLCVAILIAISSVNCLGKTAHKSALLKYDKQIDGIIKQMTLEEKINMLHAKHMFVSAGVERLGIAT